MNDNNRLKNKESILLVGNFTNTTGYAWRSIYKLYNSIAKSMHERGVSVCLSFSSIIEPITILDANIPYSAFTFNTRNSGLKELKNLRQRIKQHNIKYIYMTDCTSWSWRYLLFRLWGVKKIVVHQRTAGFDPGPIIQAKGWSRIRRMFVHKLRIMSVDKLYVISDYVSDFATKKACFPHNRITKIYNGIDCESFVNVSKRLGSEIVIFSCSRADKIKGIQYLISATAILRDKYQLDNFIVRYAGDGDSFAEFKKLADELRINNLFIFLGQIDNAVDEMSRSDIVVVPSVCGEAFSLVSVEGMAAGKALVVSRAGALPEVVGECAVIVPPADDEALAAALVDLIEDENKRIDLGIKAQDRANELFNEALYHHNVTTQLLEDIF